MSLQLVLLIFWHPWAKIMLFLASLGTLFWIPFYMFYLLEWLVWLCFSRRVLTAVLVTQFESSLLKGKNRFLTILHRYMDVHGTVYYEAQRPPEIPAFVKNHGLLPQNELQQLLRKAKVLSLFWRVICMINDYYNWFIMHLLHKIWALSPINYSKAHGRGQIIVKYSCTMYNRKFNDMTKILFHINILQIHALKFLFVFYPAFCRIWLSLWRSCPFGGHSQWLHFPSAQILSTS